jgi:hypothetical protein
MSGFDLSSAFGRFERGELPSAVLPVLDDGPYIMDIDRVEVGSDHLFISMLTEDGQRARVRLTFAGAAIGPACERLVELGYASGNVPALAVISEQLTDSTVEVVLGHYERNGATWQALRHWRFLDC